MGTAHWYVRQLPASQSNSFQVCKGTGSAATLKSLTFCKKEPNTDWGGGERRKQSFSQKVVFGGELEISDCVFLNKSAFKNSNKHHLSSRDHRLCTQLPLKDQTFWGRQNKESINERCADLSSPVSSRMFWTGADTEQQISGVQHSTEGQRSHSCSVIWTRTVMCLTWIHHIHLLSLHLPTANF